MLDELEEMMCFAAICETGSVTHAARELKKSKAYVSRKLSNLEIRIGAKLMYRSTRSLKITNAGRRLEAEALQLFHASQRLNHRAGSLDDQVRGNFVITCTHSMAAFLLAPLLNELHEEFPEVNFEIRPSNKWTDLVAEGIDLAIRSGSVADDRLIAHQIGTATDKFFASSDYCARFDAIKVPNDLVTHRLVVNSYSLDHGIIKIRNESEATRLAPPKMLIVSEQPLLVDIVRRGLGVGLAFDHKIREMEATSEVTQILPDWSARNWPLFVVYPFVAPIPAKLSKIAGFLRRRLSKMLL